MSTQVSDSDLQNILENPSISREGADGNGNYILSFDSLNIPDGYIISNFTLLAKFPIESDLQNHTDILYIRISESTDTGLSPNSPVVVASSSFDLNAVGGSANLDVHNYDDKSEKMVRVKVSYPDVKDHDIED